MGGWESGPMGVNGVNDGGQGNDSPAFGLGKVNANCPHRFEKIAAQNSRKHAILNAN